MIVWTVIVFALVVVLVVRRLPEGHFVLDLTPRLPLLAMGVILGVIGAGGLLHHRATIVVGNVLFGAMLAAVGIAVGIEGRNPYKAVLRVLERHELPTDYELALRMMIVFFCGWLVLLGVLVALVSVRWWAQGG